MKRILSDDSQSPLLSRRRALRGIGAALAAAPLVKLLGCSSDGSVAASASGDAGGDATGTGSTSENDAALSDGSADAGGWATGGTKSMTGNYPDPFSSGLGSACTLTCAATIGPCYAATLARKDISEGHDGLPVRLAFLVVDETCTPVPNASLDIWHCAPEGLYSGDDASDFCTDANATARAARWFRGVQTTDSSGRADFDTCFPGWYSSRTIHIHMTIRVGGTEYVTTQFVFDDALDDEIVSTQPLYNTRGARDTKNTNDGVVGGVSDLDDYTFQTSRMSDGAMLAWKAIVIRSSTGESLCSIGGGGGAPPGDGGGPPRFDGGPPPDGGP